MPRTLRRLALLTLALIATACGGSDTFLPGFTSRDPALQKQVWDGANVISYDYTYRRVCECLPLGEVRVAVRGGSIYSVQSVATGEALPQDRWDEIPTVNDLFTQLITAYETGDEFEALYEARLRYPAAAVIGEMANDGGVAHYVSELERYEGPWFP